LYASNGDVASYTNIGAWGDSLTSGSGQNPYTTYLTNLYQGTRYVYNFGVGGDTSGQILQRMTNYPAANGLITIIWVGRNDIGTATNSAIENNIAAMVANLGTNNKYVVLSILNASTEPSGSANYNQIIQLNSDLATLYPGHYFDIRAYLVQNGLTDAAISPSAQDLTDISNDVPPADLRINTLHLTSVGYSLVAQQIYNVLTSTLGITTLASSSNIVTQANIQSLFSSPWSIGLVSPNAAAFTDLNADNYKTGGATLLYASSTNASTYVGIGAGTELYATSTPKFNTAVGYQALGNTFQTGASNVAIGYQTLFLNSSGAQNTAVGNATLQQNTTGSQNTAVGYFALLSNTTGVQNNALGYQALFANTTGANNTAMGGSALRNNTTGIANTAFGYLSLNNNKSATTSVAVGYRAGYGITSGYSNQGSAILGYAAGEKFQTGSDFNTLIGYQSGNGITTGANNLLVGASVNSTSINQVTTGSQNISLGYNVALPSPTSSGQLNIQNIIYGTGNTGTNKTLSTGAIAIGTTTPYSRLTVWGPDSAASTTAFLVANNASTTEFAVLDNGNATLAGNLIQNSDQRLKTNIRTLDASSSLAAIKALNPLSYSWIDPDKGGIPQYGFIAQDVQKVFPNLVSVTSPTPLTPDGTLSLNYNGFIAPLVAAVQNMIDRINDFTDHFTTKELTFKRAIGDDIVTNHVHTQELCIGTTCVSEDQLQTLLRNSGMSGSSAPQQNGAVQSDASSSGNGSTSTPAVSDAPPLAPEETVSSGPSLITTDTGSSQ
jgi:hypothetical protein